MANTNEVHINGFAATDGSRTGKGPLRFRLGHGGGKKKDGRGFWPTHFFTVVTLEADAPAIVKGAEVEVRGRLASSTWEKDGEKRTTIEIVATEINLAALNHNNELAPIGVKNEAPKKNLNGLQVTDADIPF